MKKYIFIIFGAAFLVFFGFNADAQMMGRFSTDSAIGWEDLVKETIEEENAGKDIWNKLREEEIACEDMTDTQFENMGEYFMGQMMGDSHAAMNAMMIEIHGKDGENQIHEVLGKRISGCDTSATFPAGGRAWMPMTQMMWGGWSFPFGFGMMHSGYGFGILDLIFTIIWWVLVIAAIVALVKWLTNQFRGEISGKSALDILQRRYARGEIDKKEFEEKKKDIV